MNTIQTNKLKRPIFLFALLQISIVVIPTIIFSQSAESNLRSQNSIITQTTLPGSPEASGLGEYGNFPVSPYTGTANISVPVHSIVGNRLSLDVNINYKTGGIKVEDRGSGSLGVGWALNAGGSITRSVKGAPDMEYNYYDNASIFNTYYLQTAISFDLYDFFYDVVRGKYETQPDTYFYSFNGRAGKFHIGADKRVIQTEDSDLEIKPTFEFVTTTLLPAEQIKVLTKFIIVDEFGTKYHFEDAEYSVLQYDDVQALALANYKKHEYNSTWHLSKIESHDGIETIDFDYQSSSAAYPAPYNINNYKYRNFQIGVNQTGPCGIANNGNGTEGVGGLDNHYTLNRRYIKEITCSFKSHKSEKLIFEYSDNPCSAEATDLQLDKVKIYKGVGAAYHRLTHRFDYQCLDNRLFLDKTGLIAPAETNYGLKPPYEFTYHNLSLPSFSSSSQQSNSQDKWGFYNGISNSTLIPDTDIPGITWQGANRSSNGSFAVARSLTRVTYPTKGYTEYNYEGNVVNSSSSSLNLTDCSGFGCVIPLESCQADLLDCGTTACVDPTEKIYNNIYFISSVINNGYFIIKGDSICGSGILQRTPNLQNSRSNSWTGTASITIIDPATGLSVGQYNKSFYTSSFSEPVKLNKYFNLKISTPYTVIITGVNSRVSTSTKIGTITNNIPLSIGGVRISKIKHYDRNGVFLKGRKYDYQNQNGTQSSGIIVQEPVFEKIGSYAWTRPPMLDPDLCDGYGYTTVRLTSSASYPLGSFDGSFYGYSRVEEIDMLDASGNTTDGKRVYHFHNSKKAETAVDVIENGKLEKLELFDASGLLVKDESNQYAFDIGENQREQNFWGFKVDDADDQDNKIYLYRTSSNSYIWTDDIATQANEIQREVYQSKWERSTNDYMKLTNYSSFLTQKIVTNYFYHSNKQLDGQVSEVVRYDYSTNLNVVQPSSSQTTNSNGDKHRMEYKYYDSYTANSSIKQSLDSRNIILPAWQTTYFYNDNQIDGQQSTYSYYNASNGNVSSSNTLLLYPRYADRYERTWNKPTGTQTIGILSPSGFWDRQIESKQYDTGTGKPTQIRRRHWPHDDIYIYDDVGNMLSHQYDEYVKSWTYHDNSYLLDKSTNIDLTSQSSTWDGLLRLWRINDNDRNVLTTFNYFYNANHNVVRTSTNYPRLGGTNRTLSNYEFIDDIGRSYQTLQYAQGPTSAKSVVSGRSYDKVGRIRYQYEPKAVNNTTNPTVLTGDKTTFTYDASPLNRVTEVMQPETWMKTRSEYGTNKDGEVDGYDANMLYKIDQYDGNNTLITVFTDKRGNEVLSRRITIDKFGTEVFHDDFKYYDGKDRLTTTVPPGATKSNSDLLFRKAYAPNDLLVYEHIPGKGEINYINSTRGQLIHKQDPLMKFHDQDLFYTYRYDSYGNLSGEGWKTSNVPANDASALGSPNLLCASHIYGSTGRNKGKPVESSHDLVTSNISGTNNGPSYTSHFTYNNAGLLSKKEWNHPLSTGDKSLKEHYIYDSADNLIQSRSDYKAINSDPIEYNISTVIDHANRPKEKWYGQGSSAQQQLASYIYTAKDEVSQLTIGGDVEQIDYTYLKNSLPKNQTSPHFNSFLYYNDTAFGQQSRKNGDISVWYWTNNNGTKWYAYEYDKLDRLTHAKRNNSSLGSYSSTYSYDKRGNLNHLTRRNSSGVQIDSLRYGYTTGNRLANINDQAGSLSAQGYKGGAIRNYGYDSNGNIKSDQSRTTTSTYNHMNLPYEITQNSTNKIKYDYDFGGKLLSIHQTSAGNTKQTHYIGNVEYEGNQIKRVNHEHGYFELEALSSGTLHIPFVGSADASYYREKITSDAVVFSNEKKFWAEECIELQDGFEVRSGVEFLADMKPAGKETYFWTIKDHQNSVRVILNGDGGVEHSQDYYPFGLRHDYTSDPTYDWNRIGGLEQTGAGEHLDVMAYRICDRLTGRFNSVDLLSSSMSRWSGYSMNFNSPLNFTDPLGLAPEATDEQMETFNKAKRLANKTYDNTDPPAAPAHGYHGQFINAHYHVWTKGNIQIHQYWNGEDWLQERVNTWQTGVGSGLSIDPNSIGNSQFADEVSSIVFDMLAPFLLLPLDVGLAAVKTGRTVQASKLLSASMSSANNIVKVSSNVIKPAKHNFKYANRVRIRALEDPVSHNFPYSFDDVILSTPAILKNNGYKIFQKAGTMNSKKGVYEIGLTKNGVIDHRFFRPY